MRWGAILIVVAAVPVLLRAELLPIKTYTTADGLPSDRISSIVADSRGFLWFSTPEGLSRFDGYHFVNYGVDEGLPDGTVVAFCEGRSGDRWIATTRGLSRLAARGQAGRFTDVSLGPEAAGSSIVALARSRSREIWVATESNLFEWTDQGRWRRRDVPSGFQHITALAEDTHGSVWVGTTTGIVVIDESGAVQTFTPLQGLPGRWVQTLFQDAEGRMWAALRGGLAQFRVEAAGRRTLAKVYTDELAGTGVIAVTEDSDKSLWVGTSQGISRLRWESDGDPRIETLTRAQGLSDREITALAEDQAGNMWVGTESAGVMRIGRVGFTTYREQDGLSSDRVWSVVEGRAGELLAVTIPEVKQRSKSVDIFDGGRFRTMAPSTFADNPTWAWNQVLLQSASREWWAATAEGLCRFDAVRAADLDRRRPRTCYLPDTTAFSVFEDSRGDIWSSAQSAQGDRLVRWNRATDTLEEFAHPRVPADPSRAQADDLVTVFAEDRHANIWMGLYKGGLYRYDGQEFRHFEERDGVPTGAVLALLATDSGLWIGSNGGGLGRIADTASAHPKIEVYTRATGMSSDIIECLVEDRVGHIYAGTGKGVDRLDPTSDHIRHFSTADGLARGQFHGAARDRSGALWFATTLGLSRLIPGDDPRPLAPRIFITSLRLGGEDYAVSQLGAERIAAPDLNPSQDQVQVEFVGIDYEPGAVVRYSYKLEGADTSWSAPRDQQSVSFAALRAGTYKFLVKAVTSDGAESVSPAEVDFVVLAPIWKRWWFMSLMATALATLVLAAHRYRVAHIVSLERMRTDIATDLHDDIGASLTQIAILSEVARVGGDGRGPSEPLERVGTLARELVDSIGDIVWSIRSEPDGWDSLVRHMREFALDVLGSQGIDFELRAPSSQDDVHLTLQLRRQLFLMFKECVHNAARHSRGTAVEADLHRAHGEVILAVEDNGLGSDAGEQTPGPEGGTGIQGLRRRAQSLGGRVDWILTPGRGCRVEIRIPLRRRGWMSRVS
jgi:ligand-binding sensor domain-containing protein/signal transduction histidine kinase